MTASEKNPIAGSIAGALLLMSFYGQLGREAYWALALVGLHLFFFTGASFFLRAWISGASTRFLFVLSGTILAQAVWVKLQVAPWWVLTSFVLFFPTAETIREPQQRGRLFLRAVIFAAAILCFFAIRSGLELTESRYFWESPAGHLSLLALTALTLSCLERREVSRGA